MQVYGRYMLGLIAGSLVVLGGFQLAALGGPGSSAGNQPTTGYQLADELNLSRVHNMEEASACEGGVAEVEPGVAYCLAGSADSSLQEWKIAMRLRGIVPTTAEVETWQAMQAVAQAANTGASPAEVHQLVEEYEDAKAACGSPCE
jgi:hypothetical protein